MRSLIRDITHLWHAKILFKLASCYIIALIVLVLILDWLPFPFPPNNLDLNNTTLPPIGFKSNVGAHLAGTDALGRDVFVNTAHGARTGLSIAFPVMIISSILGVFVGACSGYFGNKTLKFSTGGAVAVFITTLAFCFYGIYIPLQSIILELGTSYVAYSLTVLAIILLFSFFLLLPVLLRFKFFRSKSNFALDKLVLRVIEILTSVPKLILILALASFITPSILTLSLILILTYWTGTARLARAEMLRINQLQYIEAARSLGIPSFKIILKQALPNLLGPVVVSFTFGLAGLLAVESTLSFLGIGLPATTPSWGRMIAGIRSDMSAWWLVVVPGTFLTITILAFQTCSYYILNSLQENKNL